MLSDPRGLNHASPMCFHPAPLLFFFLHQGFAGLMAAVFDPLGPVHFPPELNSPMIFFPPLLRMYLLQYRPWIEGNYFSPG